MNSFSRIRFAIYRFIPGGYRSPQVIVSSGINFCIIRRSTLVGQRPMKSLSSDCPSVGPSVCPSLSFLKIGSSVFSDIVHDDS